MTAKGKIRELIDRHPVYHAEQIIEKVKPFQYVSFDIFDTLIKRSVPTPKDVFEVTARRYNDETGENIDAGHFQKSRIEAEKAARDYGKMSGREETTLEEIYSFLPSLYYEQRDALMALELAQEKSCCHVDPVMQIVFQWCREHQKHIFLISDMYLSYETMEEILHQSGICGYERLFLSSKENATKHSGKLFSTALNELSIEPSKIIHIGDHLRSDYLNAKKHGMKAIWIARNPKRTKFTRFYLMPPKMRRQYRRIGAIMNGCIAPDWAQYYQFGFEALGPLLYGFCTWLHEDAKKRQIERLFFLSRDGYLLQKAYHLLYGENALDNRYLYASRKALHTPCLWLNPEFDAVMSVKSPYKKWNYSILCDELGIDTEQGKKAWIKCGLHEDQYFITRDLIKNPNALRFFDMVRKDVVENSQKKYDILLKYLRQNKFSGNVAIVDIGWAGTMQCNLQKLLDMTAQNTLIYGYYVGLTDRAPAALNASPYIPKRVRPKLGCTGFLEFLFPAPEGSTRGYECCGEESVPALFPYEYENYENDVRVRFEIQEGALEFVRVMKTGMGQKSVDGTVAYQNLRLAGRMPRRQEREMFGPLMFMDSELHPLAMPKSLGHYLCHPKQMLPDFLDSRWKSGFARELLKLPLPYHWVFIPFEK